jgi:hypothetical protein
MVQATAFGLAIAGLDQVPPTVSRAGALRLVSLLGGYLAAVFGQSRGAFIFSVLFLVLLWSVAAMRGLRDWSALFATAWTLRTVVLEWWHPWSSEAPEWARTRSPSKNPDDYR